MSRCAILPWVAFAATACLAQGVATLGLSRPGIAWRHGCVTPFILALGSAPAQPRIEITLFAGCDTPYGFGGGALPSFAFQLRFTFLFIPEGGAAAPRELQATLVKDYLPPWTEDEERRELEYRLSGLAMPGRGRLRIEARLGADTFARFQLDLPGVLEIRVLDGRDGKAIAGAFLTARLSPRGPKSRLRTSAEGEAYLELPGGERELSIRMHGLTDCRPKRTTHRKIPLATILHYGVSAENRCGPAKVGSVPGQLVLFAEPRAAGPP